MHLWRTESSTVNELVPGLRVFVYIGWDPGINDGNPWVNKDISKVNRAGARNAIKMKKNYNNLKSLYTSSISCYLSYYIFLPSPDIQHILQDHNIFLILIYKIMEYALLSLECAPELTLLLTGPKSYLPMVILELPRDPNFPYKSLYPYNTERINHRIKR